MKAASSLNHTGNYYAHGKLMLAGEYLVLKGASALMVPLKTGQSMMVTTRPHEKEKMILWQASVRGKLWFTAQIDFSNWTIVHSTHEVTVERLINILRTAGTMNRRLFKAPAVYQVSTHTEFSMHWGFGSSAALYVNIARWAGLDPFSLFFRVSSGSGADIAAAGSSGPLIYKLHRGNPEMNPVHFQPAFHRNIFFAYLGQKQDTTDSINDFMANTPIGAHQIKTLDRITEKILSADTMNACQNAIAEHEVFLGGILGRIPVKERCFPDFPGEIKSLGAWGGDFIMAISAEPEMNIRSYFGSKGTNTVFSFEEIIL